MNYIDYTVIAVYILGFMFLGRLFKNNKNSKDYFLGGKSFGWFPLSMSTIATQLSAISFISAPAFVGLKQGGGMIWLTYEFAVPLAMIFLMTFLIPPMYKSGVVSVYAFLEKRFNSSTRIFVSIIFQISRAFGTSVMIYAVSLILTSVMNVPMWLTILMIGVVTLIYSYQGGMKAVVYGDMIQMFILFIGIIVCLFAGLDEIGGWDTFVSKLDFSRVHAVNFDSFGLTKGNEFGFLPMLFGGFFLYVSYYGTDQSQVQRLFSAHSMKKVRKTLLFNGILRFPITLVYCIMGLIIGTLALTKPTFSQNISNDKIDLMIPIFIRDFLPHGLIGILMIAIFSAAMSSLSSAINSLSAATIEDIFNRKKKLTNKKYMVYSKYVVIFWGLVCIILAFYVGGIAKTVIEAINKIGSVFYGPILATFIAAVGFKRIHSLGISIGLFTGVLVNVYLWLCVPDIFWFWWNAIGAIVTISTGWVISILFERKKVSEKNMIHKPQGIDWGKIIVLVVYFFLIVFLSTNLEVFFK